MKKIDFVTSCVLTTLVIFGQLFSAAAQQSPYPPYPASPQSPGAPQYPGYPSPPQGYSGSPQVPQLQVAGQIPGIDLSRLNDQQKAQVTARLSGEGCPCGCTLNLLRCRIEDSTCPVSLQRAQTIISQVVSTHVPPVAPLSSTPVVPEFPPSPGLRSSTNRPVLETRQGQYFRWSMPQGWSYNETTNGVDIVSSDGRSGASSALLVGGFGQPSPRDFLLFMLQQLGLYDVQIVSSRDLTDQPGIPGLPPWKVSEFELTFTLRGVPVRGRDTVGVIQAYGRYTATVMSYHAPVDRWEQEKLWLPAVAQSVVITNPRQVAMQDQVMLPRNNPLDNSGLLESWRQKGLSEDRISRAQREGTMGYERLEDPTTGQKYELPLEAYDPTRGGYRNPVRPDELLVKPPTGE